MTEKEIENKTILWLQSHNFLVYPQAWDSTHKFRIDIICRHVDCNRYFGIEIKLNEKKRGKDLANWIKQASNYHNCNWGEFGKLIIFAAPQISIDYLREGVKMSQHEECRHLINHNNVSTFLGQFGIGEILRYRDEKISTLLFSHTSFILYDGRTRTINKNLIEKHFSL